MADVFISYSQQAREPTLELAGALTDRGYDPWYDVNLLPGQAFGPVIDDQIDRAKAVITVWSDPAVKSEWVRAETERAFNQKKLICVRTSDVDPAKLPTPHNLRHTPLFTDIESVAAALIALGVRPLGVSESDLPPEEILKRQALADWRNGISQSTNIDEIEAYISAYRTLPLYREQAQRRLAMLRDGRINAPPPVRLVTPDDVILRLDPGMHTALIGRVAATRDGRILATGSHDKTVRLWSLPEGRLIRTIRPAIGPGNEGKIYAVGIDPAGTWVASGGWSTPSGVDGHITVLDIPTGQVRARLGPLPNAVLHIAVSPDGGRLAVGLGGQRGIRVWNTSDWSLVLEDTDYAGGAYGLAFGPAGTPSEGRLVTTCEDRQIRLYDPGLNPMHSAQAPSGEPTGICYSPDGSRIAIGYYDHSVVEVLDAHTLAPAASPDLEGVEGGNLSSIAWLSDNRVAAAGKYGSNTSPILVWEDGGRGARTAWPGPENTVMDLHALPDGGVSFGSAGPALGVIDRTGIATLFRGPPQADLRDALGASFMASEDGKRVRFMLAWQGVNPQLFDLATLTLSPATEAPAGLFPANTDGLPIAGWQHETGPTIQVKKGVFGKDQKRLPLEQYEMSRSLAVAPDAQSFLLGTDWRLRQLDASGDKVWEQAVPGVTWGITLALQGRVGVVAYGDGTIRWHRTSDGTELLALFVHVVDGRAVDWVVWTPRGEFASSPGGETLIGWHVNRGPDEVADFYPAATFANAFRKPDVVKTALDAI